MGIGLETRIPLLDHRVVELPGIYPRLKLVEGKANGFYVRFCINMFQNRLLNVLKWDLVYPLMLGYAVHCVNSSVCWTSRVYAKRAFNPVPIRQKWNEHLSGKSNWQYHLWDVLMFQAWLEENK